MTETTCELVTSESPATLGVRVREGEIGLWRDVLSGRLVSAHRRRTQAETDAARALLQQAGVPAVSGQPWVMTAGTSLLGRVICEVADAANRRCADAWRLFGEVPDSTNAEQLVVALEQADAAMAAVFALARVERDAAGRLSR